MRIIYSPKFAREYKRLSDEIKLLAEKRELTFRKNPFDQSLDTHKLRGKFKEFWSFSIGIHYRIIFEFGKDGIVYFHSVGNHSIYR